ncbi:MAG: tyrosine-type recombinase/integrase [Candidatus Udaeobacter sp.]
MARRASPWYWADRQGWFVNHEGRRCFLGAHPNQAPAPRKSARSGRWNAPEEIEAVFHKLMRGDRRPPDNDAVINILDDFIAWCYENRKPRTADRYKDFCNQFVKSCSSLGVSQLTTAHVTKWLSGNADWNSTTKRNAITALQRGFNWAVKNRGLARNPIRGMEKPEAKRRTDIITPAEFEILINKTQDQRFKEILIVSYDSGARPQEIKRLEARHVQVDKQRAVIPAIEAKGRVARAVYFPTDRSMKIIKRLLKERPEGPLFINRRGNAWTASAMKNRLEEFDGIIGRRVTHYSLRHSFVTRKLIAGVDSHVVAALAGHQDTKMIDRVYSHIADNHEFMLKEAGRDVSPKKGT